jgi:plastocyanin
MMRWEIIFAFVFLVGGFALSFTSASYMTCYDSDSGMSYGVEGYVNASYVSVPGPDDFYQFTDYCSFLSSPITSCNGTNCFVYEYYCTGGGVSWDVNVSQVTCESLGYTGGCVEGACVNLASGGNCSDGIQNNGETGVDCGGPCPTCPIVGGYWGIDIHKGSEDPGNHNWTIGYINKWNDMMQLRIKAVDADVYITQLVFTTSGTANEEDLSFAYLAVDSNNNGKRDSDEEMIGILEMTSDNQDLVFDLDNFELNDGETVYFVVTYQMNDNLEAGTTFSLELETLRAEKMDDGQSYIFYSATSNAYINTKTILGSQTGTGHCSNGIMESYLGETGVDCGGECPTCPISYDECYGECNVYYPLCEPMSRTVYSCFNGALLPAPIPYDYLCPPGGGCYDGDFLCDFQNNAVDICVSGAWIRSYEYEEYEEFCNPYGCDYNSYGNVQCFEGDAYICNGVGGWEPAYNDPEAEAICEGGICNPGELFCDYFILQVLQCSEDGLRWESMGGGGAPITPFIAFMEDPEDLFNTYCGGTEASYICQSIGEERCNFITSTMEICTELGWSVLFDTQMQFQEQCADKECNDRWFKCDPVNHTVAFCGANNMWGLEEEDDYIKYCKPKTPTWGQGPQIVSGEVVNNTVVVREIIPQVIREPIRRDIVNYTLNYWIIGTLSGLLLILLVLVVIYATKYYESKKFLGSKSSKKNEK